MNLEQIYPVATTALVFGTYFGHSPNVILMDEPCSALDPKSTAHIEDLITVLKDEYTIVIVTHNMHQAARVSDHTAFFFMKGNWWNLMPQKTFSLDQNIKNGRLYHRPFWLTLDEVKMSRHMELDLQNIRNEVTDLVSHVENIVVTAVKSLVERDKEMATKIVESDTYVNQKEVDIEESCLKVLALHQPVAMDLRYLIGVIKLNNDIERIADLAVNVAERALYLVRGRSSHSAI